MHKFEGFDIDLDRGRLIPRGGGEEKELRPQLLTILRLLIERAGEVVSRDELRTELWGDTVVDTDNGLNFCIRQIRQLLGDDAKNPRFLETVPRRGYVWIAKERGSAPAASSSGGEVRFGPRVAALIFAVALAAMAITGGSQNAIHIRASGESEMSAVPADLRRAYLEAHHLREMGWEEMLDPAYERLDYVLSEKPGWFPAVLEQAVVRLRRADARPEEIQSLVSALRRGVEHPDPELAVAARLRLAQVEMASHWDWQAARRHLDQALLTDPSNSLGYRYLAKLETTLGRHDAARRAADRAIELEPVEALTHGNQFMVHYFIRDYEVALDLAERTLRLVPGHYSALFVKVCSAEGLGRWQTAAEAVPELLAHDGVDVELPDDPRAMVEAFHRLRLDLRRSQEVETSWQLADLALSLAKQGKVDSAFVALEQALDRRSMHVIFHLSNGRFDPIRSDPRWAKTMIRLGLEERLSTDEVLVGTDG